MINWMAGFFPANQSFLKTFQTALIGWIKAGPPKEPLLFCQVIYQVHFLYKNQ